MPKITQHNLNEYISEWRFKMSEKRLSFLTLNTFIQPDKTIKYGILDLGASFSKVEKAFIYTPMPSSREEWFYNDCRYDTIAEALVDINYILDNPDKF